MFKLLFCTKGAIFLATISKNQWRQPIFFLLTRAPNKNKILKSYFIPRGPVLCIRAFSSVERERTARSARTQRQQNRLKCTKGMGPWNSWRQRRGSHVHTCTCTLFPLFLPSVGNKFSVTLTPPHLFCFTLHIHDLYTQLGITHFVLCLLLVKIIFSVMFYPIFFRDPHG